MANVTRISTGFMSGNLFNDIGYDERASAEKYQAALFAALKEAFPEAEIIVKYQHASGSLPYPLKTAVDFDEEPAWDEEEQIKDTVTLIKQRVYEDYDVWVVEETEEK